MAQEETASLKMIKTSVQRGPQATRNRRRHRPRFVGLIAHSMDLGERKSPLGYPPSKNFNRHVEDLDEPRTKPGKRRVSAPRGRAGEKGGIFQRPVSNQGFVWPQSTRLRSLRGSWPTAPARWPQTVTRERAGCSKLGSVPIHRRRWHAPRRW